MNRADAGRIKNELWSRLTAKDLDPKTQALVKRALVGVGVEPTSPSEGSILVWLSMDDPAAKALCEKFLGGSAKPKYLVATVPTIPAPIPASSKRTAKRYHQRLPIFPGVAVGHPAGRTATLGCIVARGTDLFVLTSATGAVPKGAAPDAGIPLCQPGHMEGCHTADAIATLVHWDVLDPLKLNASDAALAQIIPKAKRLIRDTIDEQIPFNTIGEARTDTPLQKYGRTSGWTIGKLVDASFNGTVVADGQPFPFCDLLVVQGYNERKKPVDFMQGGDAGAALIHLDGGRATLVGLIVASMAGGYALATPISTIFQKYALTLAHLPPPSPA